MKRFGNTSVMLVVVACGVLLASAVWAQQTASSVAGVVKDAVGMPVAGVKVDAASDALIEKVRTVFTDSQGEYKIVDLPVGMYEVTFSATGFSTVKNPGVELAAAFTATVNASLQAGSSEQIITVTGSAKAVDSQNSNATSVVTGEAVETLPVGTKSVSSVSNVTGGMTTTVPDVGGAAGILNTGGNGATYHGKVGIKRLFNGSRIDDLVGVGSAGYIIDPVAIGDIVTETGGGSAESVTSGFMINSLPKSGSNVFHGDASGLYTNGSLQSNNLDAQDIAAGLTTTDKIVKLFDYSADLGGPIAKDRMWFFVSARYWGRTVQRPGIFNDATEGSAIYTPNLSQPGTKYDFARSPDGHFTWQMSPKNKISAEISVQSNCFCGTATFAAVEADNKRFFYPNAFYQVAWSSPVTSKLLLEAAAAFIPSSWPMSLEPGVVPGATAITEASNGFTFNGPASYNSIQDSNRYNQRFTAAYVTGSHAIKVGFNDEEGIQRTEVNTLGTSDIAYTFLGGSEGGAGAPGKPNAITEYATPYEHIENMNADIGLFAQDQWTLKRLTLNYGVRFEYFNSSVPAESVPATLFVPARSYAALNDVPDWKDVSPRFGAAYDLSGDGKTAVRVAIGKFMNLQAVVIANANNPLNTSVNSVTRTWNDTNLSDVNSLGNYVPNCNLQNPAANGDCGAISNSAFGGPHVVTTYANDVTQGWGARDHIWDLTMEIQRELFPGTTVKGGYYRNWGENFTSTNNVAVTPSAYSPYCVTAPADSRLPGGGGYPICGLYDIAPSLFSAVQNVVEQSSHFGTQTYINNYFNATVTTRFGPGIRLTAAMDTGKQESNQCFVVNSPQQAYYNQTTAGAAGTGSATNTLPCDAISPWLANLQIKVQGSIPLPAGVTLSGTFQNLAGPQILASYNAPNSLIAPSLERNLAACGTKTVCTATANLPLITPGTQYEPRRTQSDLRLAKTFRVGGTARLTGKFDLYNAFNANGDVSIVTTYGPSWLQPTQILDGRLAEITATLSY